MPDHDRGGISSGPGPLPDEAATGRAEVASADRDIQESAQRYAAIFDRAPFALALSQMPEGRLVAANDAFLQLFELVRAEALGRTSIELGITDVESRAVVMAEMRRRGFVRDFEASRTTRSGVQRHISLSIEPISIGGQQLVLTAIQDVDERKRAQEALAASRERLAVTLESIGDAVIATDEAARISLFNGVAARLTGWSAAEAIGRPLHEVFRIVSEDTGLPVPSPVERVLREGVVVGLANHTALLARDGTALPIADSGAPIRDGAGRLAGVVLVFRDQVEERRAERALRESRDEAQARAAELTAVLDAVPAAVFISRDPDGRVIQTNRFCAELLAVPEGANVSRELPPGDRPWSHRLFHRGVEVAPDQIPVRTVARTNEELRGFEMDLQFPDGSWRHLLGNASPMRGPDGQPVGAVAALVDITDRKRNEERFRALIEESTDMLLVLDDHRRVVFWSPSAAQQLGWSQAEMLGRDTLDHIHPEDRALTLERLRALLEMPDGTVRFSRRQLHKDGSIRVVEVIARNLLHAPAVRGVVVNLRDVTRQRELEEQFRQAQKLESIGRLAGGVAHDFNNLLTVIMSCAETLHDDVEQDQPIDREHIQEIRQACQRASDLTRQLLAFARKQVIAPVPLDLGAAVAGSERLLRRILGESIEIRVRQAPALWRVRCDPGQLEQVILNLAVNARDAMPQGGTLELETGNLVVDEDRPSPLGDVRAGEYVRLTVRDSGVGMSAEVKAHLFEPFFTTKPTGSGTGLGLATVYGIVKQSEGHLRVDSEPGRGTTFELLFPRTLDVEARRAAPPRTRTRGTESILLVEDDPGVREVTARSLRAAGYDVLVAAQPEEALRLTTERLGGLDLLITDVVMPGMDGRALATALGQRRPGLRVLYVSGYTRDAIASSGVLDTGIAFLEKPFAGPALLARVRAILDQPPAPTPATT